MNKIQMAEEHGKEIEQEYYSRIPRPVIPINPYKIEKSFLAGFDVCEKIKDVEIDRLTCNIGALKLTIRCNNIRIQELESQVETLEYNGLHTCHANCKRLPCVQRRKIDELEAEIAKMREGCDERNK